MQRGVSSWLLSLCLFVTLGVATAPNSKLYADTAKAGPTAREAALFVRHALVKSSPFSYWSGDKTSSPTMTFHMAHRPWHQGSDAMRREGIKILGCVTGLLNTSLNDAAKPILTIADSPHHYRIVIFPIPPGGGTQLAAEGIAQRDGCPKGREQDLILRLLLSKSNRHAF